MANLAIGLASSLLWNITPASILTGVGTSLLVTTITKTTTAIGSNVKIITTSDNPSLEYVKKELAKIDLVYTVEVIKEVVREQDIEGKEMKDSIKRALLGVNEILEKIHDELNTINESIKNHESKYFNGWRGFTCKYNLRTIIKHKNILDSRYKIFIDLLKVYNTEK
jgi:cellobiose-specific phosphotransferase system component IIB